MPYQTQHAMRLPSEGSEDGTRTPIGDVTSKMIEDPKYHYCNETLPCMYEDERGQLFYFPYKYESILGIERAMTDRKAFDLRLPLIFWNATLAVLSLVGTIRIGEEFV
ncbi:hypothetical protein PRIPAC_82355 [Pristionchus pacificus]|uniref:Very-long-chain 3-oxoacyl-CoA synthase n=1 Tax=Pristionchus pacificus TaxID=54126 RepID=A0A2A6CLE5_PRIPA|nr:hypothetical protein PRIPAC_82355 [Pristionchus pacificus]|eukprot:PDM78897.1 hypothetical protein PRIPAC_31476 [Pristionchus pacificus]